MGPCSSLKFDHFSCRISTEEIDSAIFLFFAAGLMSIPERQHFTNIWLISLFSQEQHAGKAVANSTLATSLRVNGNREIEFPLPDIKTRRRIFRIHTSRMTLADDVSMEEFVMNKDEFSGADIKAICTEAGLLALRERCMKERFFILFLFCLIQSIVVALNLPKYIAFDHLKLTAGKKTKSHARKGQRLLQTVGPDLTALSTKELVGLVHRLRFYKAPLTRMKKQMSMINEIQPGMRNWGANIIVTEKSLPKMATNGKVYQKLMFRDSEGTRIQAVIFGNDIDTLGETLKIYHTYCIRNAMVQEIPTRHKIIESPNQWILSERTPIEEATVDDLSVRNLKYNFMPLGDTANYYQTADSIDALFAIIDVGQHRKVTDGQVTDVIVIDHCMKPTGLTLWDQFGTKEGNAMSKLPGPFPTVIGVRRKINQYNGLTLATKGSSSFIFNPAIPEANTLHNWCMANAAAIKKIPFKKGKQPAVALSNPPTKDTIIKINQLPTIVSSNEFHSLQVSCYVVGWNSTLCKCKFDVQLQDSTGLIIATAFAEIAEKLFKVTAEELYANTINGELALHCMERLSDSRDYVIDVRTSKYDAQQSSLCRFFVNAVYDVATLMPSDDLSLEKTTKKNPRETSHNEASSDPEPIISDSSKLVAEEASNTNKLNSKKKKE
ncbi:hypothetical protein Vadar_030423 [Vaccinium darrowii]|uniref:Uncharacterized protein n=1 Tax=Vaccinium darrowii TaxID=229202 RepID=A0ACB7Z7W4_9ERIC|nr:hypothetical protein Vadar_030423 [Vaccinium darrowii]